MKNQNINTNQDYKYGFTTDIERINKSPIGFTADENVGNIIVSAVGAPLLVTVVVGASNCAALSSSAE